MTQGIFILSGVRGADRPKSKKMVREAIAAGIPVRLQATSFFGNEYDGLVSEAPAGTYTFVGPDPERSRNFFGQIIISDNGVRRTVVVK